MNLSRLAPVKVAAVLVTAFALLGCEAPPTNASEETPPVYPAASSPSQPNLVTVTNVAATNSLATNAAPEQGELNEPPAVKPVELTTALQEVVKLAESGVDDDVILAFIQNSPTPFHPTPEQILFLTDIGLSDVIITALVNHRGTQPEVAQQPTPSAAAPVQGVPAPESAPEATYNPEPQVVYSSPPVVQYVTPAPVVEYDYFYSSLSPYGTWVDIPSYGRCWQPTVGIRYRDWRPYCDRGRWLSTDHGWYWHSDYSWGWAPFHYGRWFHYPARGWCWRPDSVWAPAWVSWRYTDSHCGWAPLPPGSHFRASGGFSYYGANVGVSFGFGLRRDSWTFVSAHRFRDREVWRHRVPGREHGAVFGRSKVINNYVVNNNTIINKGVGSDRVPALGRSEPRKIAIRDLPGRGRTGIRPDRLHQEGSDLVVYRPRPLAPPQHSLRTLERDAAGTIRSQPSGAGRPGSGSLSGRSGGAVGTPAARPRSEPPPADVTGSRPIRALGSERPNAVTAQPQLGARRPLQGPASPVVPNRNEPSRSEPSRSWSVLNSGSGQNGSPAVPQSVPQPVPTARQEPAKTSPGRGTPATSAAAPQTYRVPGPARPGWNQSTGTAPAPQAVGTPVPTRRQEISKPATTVAPEKYTFRAPAAVSEPLRIDAAAPSFRSPPRPSSFSVPSQSSRPAPSFSPSPVEARPGRSYSAPAMQTRPVPSFAPAQTRPAPSFVPSRPAPSFSAPAVQSRPAPSYSPPAVQSRPSPPATSFVPASRPAPRAAPAPTQTSRSGSRRD